LSRLGVGPLVHNYELLTRSEEPVAVTGLRDVVDLVAGEVSTCARRRDGTWWCWRVFHDGTTVREWPTPTLWTP
jgi:hypothetical protein